MFNYQKIFVFGMCGCMIMVFLGLHWSSEPVEALKPFQEFLDWVSFFSFLAVGGSLPFWHIILCTPVRHDLARRPTIDE